MKFILNENKKFLLEERFILQEASMGDVAKQWTDRLESTFPKTEKVLQLYIKHSGTDSASKEGIQKRKELKTAIEKATEELENSLSLPYSDLATGKATATIKKELVDYGSELIKVEETIGKTDSNKDILQLLDNRISELQTIRNLENPFAGGDKNFKALMQIFKWVNDNIIPLFATDTADKDEAKFKEFQELCTECLNLIKDLRVDLPDDFSEFSNDSLKSYYTLIQAALDASNLNVTDMTTKLHNITTLDSYLNAVQTLKDALTKLTQSVILNPDTTQDWKTKYANAQNKEAVIEEFIYTTWKNDYDAVLKIKKTLLQECDAFGFTDSEKGNPFISYISNIYLKYKIEPELYNIVHNMVATQRLTGADLLGKGSMGQGNLVFCKALYTAGAGAAKLYLRKQYNLLHATKLPEEFETAAEMAFNALYKLSAVVKGEQTKNSINLELRPMTEVEQLETQWVGQVSDTATDDEKPKKTTATNAELLNQMADTNAAVKVLAALAIKFSSNDQIVAAVQSCKEAKELMNGATTWEKVQKLVAQEERLYKIANITATQALNLIKSILDSDKFSLTKE